ncbi:MAG: UDP-N-acetylmuramoyl-L-alanine--D-glutamate ligase [Phycisphaerales bacterium]|nr:UDP-N-acetylmuramoyl-L-alanine--D-glutamate ligase [Phycisphaerales bacterium]
MSDDWNGKRVTVMGLGRFGGGVGVARWLAAQGARVTVTDKAPAAALAESVAALDGRGVTLRLGEHVAEDFAAVDLVVVNPAVPDTSEFVQCAHAAGVSVTTEINLFVERCRARCIGITGSVGKSTVTAMTGHILGVACAAEEPAARPGRRVWVGGNIGCSLLDMLPEIATDDLVVLELSSFQLQRTPLVRWSPHIALLTNITPNHLDWHGTFAAYVAAKLNILRYQDPARDAIIMADEPVLRGMIDQLFGDVSGVWRYGLDGDRPRAIQQSTAAVDCDDRRIAWPNLELAVPGRHNRLNAAAALTVAYALGVPGDVAVAALRTFAALPHRLQRVAEVEGVAWYDDSKSTTPEAALTALAAFERPVLVILGGYDKGSDLGPLAIEVARRARFAACIGKTGAGLAVAIARAGGVAEDCGTLAVAVAACRARAQVGDVVLLSPACASWDQFEDYRARGLAFANLALAGADVPQ